MFTNLTVDGTNCFEDSVLVLRYVFLVIVPISLGLFGSFSNLLTFVLLCRQKPFLTTNVIMQGIALADTIILIQFVIFSSLPTMAECGATSLYGYNAFYKSHVLYFRSLVIALSLLENWLTVLLSVERFITVSEVN